MTRTGRAVRFAIPVTLLCMAVCFAGCSADEPAAGNGGPGNAGQSPDSPTADPAPEWVEFTSEAGGFQATFPNEPHVEPGEEPYVAVIESASGPATYAVAYADLPDFDRATTSPKMVLDDARKGSAVKVQGKELSQEQATIAGHSGQAYRVDMPSHEAIGEHRLLMVDTRVYHLSVIGPKDGFDEAAAEKFFESFALTTQE